MFDQKLQLIRVINYRQHYVYIYQYPEFVVFNWLVVVNAMVDGSAGVHWLSSYSEAALWGKRCVEAIYAGSHSQFLEQSQKAGEIPFV